MVDKPVVMNKCNKEFLERKVDGKYYQEIKISED